MWPTIVKEVIDHSLKHVIASHSLQMEKIEIENDTLSFIDLLTKEIENLEIYLFKKGKFNHFS